MKKRLGIVNLARCVWKQKVIIISFYVSLLLPTYCVSNARCFYEQLRSIRLDSMERGVRFEFQGELLSKVTQKRVEELGVKHISYQFRLDEIIPEVSLEKEITVKGYGGEFQVFHGISLVSGRFFESAEINQGRSVCMISDTLAVEEGLKIDDRVKLHGEQFQIVGINREYGRDMIVIPYQLFNRIYGESFVQQEVDCSSEIQSGESKKVEELLREVQGSNIDINKKSLLEIKKENQMFVKGMIFPRVIATIIASVFSLLNIFVVLLGTMEQRKEQYAIRRAIGAVRRDIFILFIKENSFNMFVAEVLLLITFQKIIAYIGVDQEVTFDAFSILGTVVIAFGFCVLLSFLLAQNVMKQNIYELLQGESI